MACLFGGVIEGEEREREMRNDFPEIEGYEVLEEIGNGGMGVVFRAQQESPSREVALKVVAPFSLRASEARSRFLMEIEAMAAVEHRGLLPLYDAGEDAHGRPWLTMLLAKGGTLVDRISKYERDWRKIAELVMSLCESIQFAHERGILHRDLKPANILFDEEGHEYVADFGLAKWADEDASFTKSSAILGSPAYLAPEAARGGSKATTTVSDVYGLGAILYELLVGEKPYDGEHPAEVLTQILDRSPVAPRQRLGKIPRDLEVIVLKAMARTPGKRYHSAAAFGDDLKRWLEGKAILARPVGLLERAVGWARRNPALAVLSFLLVASVTMAGLFLWQANQKLQASLDDVEGRVEFMTRELPASLAPLGRLDLLDGVFLNVAEHYDRNARADAESLARHSDFLTQWSQVLRDRGRTESMIGRLEMALEKAEEAVAATTKGEMSVEVARARVEAGWRLGEVLLFTGESSDAMDPKKLAMAREVLEETAQFAEGLDFEDVRYEVLRAQLAVELMILETNSGGLQKALAYGDEAKERWLKVKPRLMVETSSAHMEAALIASTDVHYFLMKVHDVAEDEKAMRMELGMWVGSRRELVESYPGNLQFLHRYASARKSTVVRGGGEVDEKVKVLEEVNQDFVGLLMRDPSNVRWQTEAVTTARLLAENEEARGNLESHARWMGVMSERLLPLYQLGDTSYLKILKIRREDAAFCGLYFLESDWGKAFAHLSGSVEAQIRVAELSNNEEERGRLRRMGDRMKTMLLAREDERFYLEWARKLGLE